VFWQGPVTKQPKRQRIIASEEHNFQGGNHAIHNIGYSNRPGKAGDQGYSEAVQGARELAKKMGAEIEHVFFTSGGTDIVTIVNAPNGDNVAKLALAIGALGNLSTNTVRAWSEAEFVKLVSELP
jgi:uncharacterized protein with GYD domain